MQQQKSAVVFLTHLLEGTKKSLLYLWGTADFHFLCKMSESCFSYFTQAESHFTESHATESQATTESHFAESQQTEVESQAALFAVLLPQEAKEIAANAANTNTKFFIFFSFLICKTIILLRNGCKVRYFFLMLYHLLPIFFLFSYK